VSAVYLSRREPHSDRRPGRILDIRVDNVFEQFLAARASAERIKLTVYRLGEKLNLQVTPAPRLTGAIGVAQGGVIQAQAVALPGGPQIKINTPQQPFDPANAAPPGLKGVLAGGEVGAGEIEALGMGVEDLAPALALAFNIPKGVKGVIIAEVANQAQAAGLLAGDVIRGINNRRVKSVVDFIKVMNTVGPNQDIVLDIYRQGQRFTVTMKG